MGHALRTLVLVLVPVAAATGCVDVRNFAGGWTGAVVGEDAVRQGFAATTRVDPLTLDNVEVHAVTATLSTSDNLFQGARLTRVVKLANDALASLTFDGAPLRSYLLYAPLASDPAGAPAHVVISLFGDDHVELRVFRGNDLFGVFNLRRKDEGG